jgi:selenocysteine lyase/cysteine desulfurase
MTSSLPFLDLRREFRLDPGTVWLNTAHQGALPRAAAREALRAVRWKSRPHELTTERFSEVPRALKTSLGAFTGLPAEEIILANGASYGLHLLANGLPLDPGDEVLLMEGDFPSNLLPWLDLRRRGVAVRALRPRGEVLTPAEVAVQLAPRTRAVCLSWVHSFSGLTLDLERIGEHCRANGTWLLLNATQALGWRGLDPAAARADALVCAGWKWLCGPYGTGFAWLRPELRSQLRYNQAYWLARGSEASLRDQGLDLGAVAPEDARRYDVFATANFFNFMPWRASLELLRRHGPARIEAHTRGLAERFLAGLDRARFGIAGEDGAGARSALCVFSHRDAPRNEVLYRRLLDAGIHLALRKGRLRLSAHLYNVPDEIDRALEILDDAG